MLLVTFTINAVEFQISNEFLALESMWDSKIISFTSPKYQLSQKYGGYVGLKFGSISLFPDLFDDDWPPPINGDIIISYTVDTEANAEVLFQGTAHRKSINRESITYDLYGPTFSNTVPDSTSFAATTLNAAMTTLCGGSYLNLTLDTTYARASSPTINFTTSGEQLAISLADAICKYTSHLFYIKDTNADGTLDTLYLVDMLLDNGSRSIDEFEFFPSNYNNNPPVSIVRDTANDYISTSSYPYGSEIGIAVYDNNQTNIETALGNIESIVNKPRAVSRMPLIGSLPNPGEQITMVDESQGQSTTFVLNSRNITFDFDQEQVTIEGEGVITAT